MMTEEDIFIDTPFSLETKTSPYKRLWRAVIAQALLDCFSFSDEFLPALIWLINKNNESQTVFYFAGMGAEYENSMGLIKKEVLDRAICASKGEVYRYTGSAEYKPLKFTEKMTKPKQSSAKRFLKSNLAKEMAKEIGYKLDTIDDSEYSHYAE